MVFFWKKIQYETHPESGVRLQTDFYIKLNSRTEMGKVAPTGYDIVCVQETMNCTDGLNALGRFAYEQYSVYSRRLNRDQRRLSRVKYFIITVTDPRILFIVRIGINTRKCNTVIVKFDTHVVQTRVRVYNINNVICICTILTKKNSQKWLCQKSISSKVKIKFKFEPFEVRQKSNRRQFGPGSLK